MIIGIASGMGFATLETMGYGFSALLQSRSIADLDQTLLLRAPARRRPATSPGPVSRRPRSGGSPRPGGEGRAVGLFVAAFAASVALHALWDGSDLWPVRAAVGIVSVAGLLFVIHRSRTAGQRLQDAADLDRPLVRSRGPGGPTPPPSA